MRSARFMMCGFDFLFYLHLIYCPVFFQISFHQLQGFYLFIKLYILGGALFADLKWVSAFFLPNIFILILGFQNEWILILVLSVFYRLICSIIFMQFWCILGFHLVLDIITVSLGPRVIHGSSVMIRR